MKVTVIPKRPIPGILPKNKWIDTKMELDLNVTEIKRCMQFGIVCDEEGNVIDELRLLNPITVKKPIIPEMKVIIPPVVIDKKEVKVETPNEPIFIGSPVVVDAPITNKEVEVEYLTSIKEVSCIKEDNYIILELEFNTKNKLENVSAFFKVNSGSKVEYKSENDKWVKFNHKFSSFEELKDGTKFVFRFIPNHKSLLKYSISIIQEKETEDGVITTSTDLNETIDQSNL